jgi:glycosyltransferase involved in cell wall biosynthesis
LISLIFPVYNPGPSLEHTWHEVARFVVEQPEAWEAIFVCDGCTDGTVELLEGLCRRYPSSWCRVLSYTPNHGKGHAVRRGLIAARGRVRVFTDVDLAYSFADIRKVADEVRAGAAAAIASREHPDSAVQIPIRLLGHVKRRRLQSRVFRWMARWLLGIGQSDTQAGLKGFSARTVEQVAPYLACDGFGFDCEVLTACSRMGIPVAEVPVCVRYRDTLSTTGMSSTVAMGWELWRTRQRWKRGLPVPLPMTLQIQEATVSLARAA